MGKAKEMFQEQLESAYELGAKNAYYGYYDITLSHSLSKDEREQYYLGYIEAPYGQKEYGVDHE